MEVTRVTVDEIKERMDRGEQFAFIDARNSQAWSEAETKLPGAIRVPTEEIAEHLSEIPRDRTAITYCSCPHEALSARVAEALMGNGFKNVHPLFGGFEAWEKEGLPLESK